MLKIIASLFVFAVLLSGCKAPAAPAPEQTSTESGTLAPSTTEQAPVAPATEQVK